MFGAFLSGKNHHVDAEIDEKSGNCSESMGDAEEARNRSKNSILKCRIRFSHIYITIALFVLIGSSLE